MEALERARALLADGKSSEAQAAATVALAEMAEAALILLEKVAHPAYSIAGPETDMSAFVDALTLIEAASPSDALTEVEDEVDDGQETFSFSYEPHDAMTQIDIPEDDEPEPDR